MEMPRRPIEHVADALTDAGLTVDRTTIAQNELMAADDHDVLWVHIPDHGPHHGLVRTRPLTSDESPTDIEAISPLTTPDSVDGFTRLPVDIYGLLNTLDATVEHPECAAHAITA
jgi:hypothetical protein